ncbi:MAG: hypothetical protein ACT4PP_16135 [Sporichthyaceae bacterium]
MHLNRSRRPGIRIPGRRPMTWAALVGLAVVLLVDGGSVAWVHVSVPDHAGEAARAGMAQLRPDGGVTPQAAQLAYTAALEVGDLHRLTIDTADFTVYAGGGLTLTARRSAPTLLFKHLPGLRELVETEVTTTVEPPRF